MRILLVRPYTDLRVARCLEQSFLRLEPLDLEIVAGGVPPDHEVAILDLGPQSRPIEAFRNELTAHPPDLVGFTGHSIHAHIVRQLAAMAKQARPDVITVVGGIHATIAPAEYAVPDIDFIVRGEGGTAIRRLLHAIDSRRPLAGDEQILFAHDPDFQNRASLPPPAYPDIRDIPRPRRDLVDRSRYFCVWTASDEGRLVTMFPRVASFRTSIGCAFHCSFCVVHHIMRRRYLQREPEDVVDELQGVPENYVYFVDDEMFLNADRTRRIAELLLERGIRKHYISWARSDTIVRHPDLFRLWKQAGLQTLYVGIEALVDSQLEGYNKGTTAETNRKAVTLLRELGITLHASLLVNPDFTLEQFRRLEKDVLSVCPAEVTVTVMSPSPGTPLWEQHRKDFICDPYRFYDCMHTILPTRLPLRRFYAHFSRLTQLALRANPIRMNRIRIPFRDLFRAISAGTRYIFALKALYKDYPQDEHRPPDTN